MPEELRSKSVQAIECQPHFTIPKKLTGNVYRYCNATLGQYLREMFLNLTQHRIVSLRSLKQNILFVCLNFVAVYISHGNRVILAGRNATFTCVSSPSYVSSYVPPYWHFYSLRSGSKPCGFGNGLYPGISRCPSVPRISVELSSTRRNRTTVTLTIRTAQLSDAGTYTCGSRNPYYLSRTLSAIVGVLGMFTDDCTLTEPTTAYMYRPVVYRVDFSCQCINVTISNQQMINLKVLL